LQSRIEQHDVRVADALANERTYLAYVRTALAFIAFGFVIARFSLFTREFSVFVHQAPPARGISTAFGTGMAIFGVLVGLLGGWRYAGTDRGLRRGEVIALSATAGYLISLFVAIIGLIVASALLSAATPAPR
jgi:putative membrane protein